MSDVEELPSWAHRTVEAGTVATSNVAQPMGAPEPERHRGRGPLFALLGVLLVGAGAFAGYRFIVRDDHSALTTADPGTTTTAEATEPSIGADQVAAEASTSTATSAPITGPTGPGTSATEGSSPSTAAAPVQATTDSSMVTADNPAGAVRYAVFKGGQLYLRGLVPAAAVATEIVTKAGMVVGPQNVHNEYQIDPTVPLEVAAPIYVEDVVLFGFNSVKVEEPFLPILDLGTVLLTQNPNVKITVVTRTDAVGSEATNLEVSQQRGQAVANYWIKKGIDPSRIAIDARGEADARDSDDAKTAALNRRAEFIITGLLG
ncbi:MAG: OmpA family protein [Acidimicrobiia bacterium]|nr:OmpA family protein [Acidimicrobiia bacterium]